MQLFIQSLLHSLLSFDNTFSVFYLLAILSLVGALAYLLTRLIEKHAYKLQLVSIPNHRSSHTKQTPHGGGLSIAVVGIFCGLLLNQADHVAYSITALAACIALIGLWDDIRGLSSALRLLVQLLCVSISIYLLNPPFIFEYNSFFNYFLLVFIGVWWINLFNFMDGIDGIAASYAGSILFIGIALAYLLSPQFEFNSYALWSLCIAAACVGFLLLNWPPARIFMGDVGSTYLAFMIFALALYSVKMAWLTYPACIILGALFVSDASITLGRRLLRGEKVTQAHRSHAYQRLSRKFSSHKSVSLLSLCVLWLYLTPCAALSILFSAYAWIIVCVAYLPIIIIILRLGAGKPDHV